MVENGSQQWNRELVDEVADRHLSLGLHYLHVERANKSAALNAALSVLRDAGGRGDERRLIVFFDDDVRVDPGILRAYQTAAACYREGGAYFGGPVSCDYEAEPPGWLRPSLPHSARGYELADRGVMTDEFLGFNWAAFASDLDDAGGFNVNVGPGSPTGARGQETEMQRRLRAHGVRPVDVPEARVWHFVPRSRCSVRWLLGRSLEMGRSQGVMGQERRQDAARAVFRSTLSVGKRALMGDQTGVMAAMRGAAYNVGRFQSSS